MACIPACVAWKGMHYMGGHSIHRGACTTWPASLHALLGRACITWEGIQYRGACIAWPASVHALRGLHPCMHDLEGHALHG
eukprot:1155302-Pelagomonas_calceolata.AAC.6